MAINRNDRRYERKRRSNNPLLTQGQQALRQAIAPFLDFARLRRNVVTKFNDKGRPDHKVDYVDFPCVITVSGEASRNSSSYGDRASVRYQVMYLSPLTLNLGDILEHDDFGVLKIVSFSGTELLGATTANAVRLGGAMNVRDGDSLRKELPDIL